MEGTKFTVFGLLACLFINSVSSRSLDSWNPLVTCPQNNRPSFQPYPLDCKSFIFCNGLSTTPHLLRCSEGQLFDSVINLCIKAANALCKKSDSSRTTPVEDYLSIKYRSKGKAKIICADKDKETFLPHPTNCSRFYKCLRGNAIEMECSPGMHFDRVSGSCSQPRTINCNVLPIYHDRSHEDECEIPKCPPYNWGNVVQFYNPLNCSEFFKCNWGVPKKFSCPPGLEYSRRLQVCDFPYLAECHLCTESYIL